MIKKLVTVVSWQNGVALVSYNVKASCNSCSSRAVCSDRLLNKLDPQTINTIVVPSKQPLVTGQKLELGIAESSLLRLAMLVYLLPLLGLFISGGVFKLLFGTELVAMCSAALGGVVGFLVARGLSQKFVACEKHGSLLFLI